MSRRERRIVLIDLLKTGETREHSLTHSGIVFRITTHNLGWDFATAEAVIRSLDGFADGFAISGIQKRLWTGAKHTSHPGYLRLLRAAARTPIYLADDLRELFTEWTLQRLSRSEPHLLAGRRLLFQCAAITPSLELFEKAGVRILAADPLILGGLPKLLSGGGALNAFLKIAYPIQKALGLNALKPADKVLEPQRLKALLRWLAESDGLVTFGALLEQMMSAELLAALEGKLLVTDSLSSDVRSQLGRSGKIQVIELVPAITGLESLPVQQFGAVTAILDLCRTSLGSRLSFADYAIQAVQKSTDQTPRTAPLYRKRPVRCAFVVHPLSETDIYRHPALTWLNQAPDLVRRGAIEGISRLPGFCYGSLRGAVSQANGQEVVCDIYSLPMTPRQILSTPEDVLYDKLVAISRQAHRNGAALLGLGAYTKVAGDAGLTVSRYSPIPVTNGNSYSASATLWAARVMSEKMGFVSLDPRHRGMRPRQKAMVIGATGSIGRVSALLVSRVTDELVLVAQRMDKLIELREEVAKMSPEIRIKVTTRADDELSDTDLIITATSNTQGQILDILKVRPGAVICDCSRPLDITAEMSRLRPDVMVIQSGEIELPGAVQLSCDIGLPKPTVYACLAETILLAMEGRFENFSLSKTLSVQKTKEIYRLGIKHGARLSAIQTHQGVVSDAMIHHCREFALSRLSGAHQQSTLTPPELGRKPIDYARWADQTILRR